MSGFNSVENLKVRLGGGGRGQLRVVGKEGNGPPQLFPGCGRGAATDGRRLIPLFEEDPDPIAD